MSLLFGIIAGGASTSDLGNQKVIKSDDKSGRKSSEGTTTTELPTPSEARSAAQLDLSSPAVELRRHSRGE
eukprot:481409-Pyramimonas_sp.AAC.1